MQVTYQTLYTGPQACTHSFDMASWGSHEELLELLDDDELDELDDDELWLLDDDDDELLLELLELLEDELEDEDELLELLLHDDELDDDELLELCELLDLRMHTSSGSLHQCSGICIYRICFFLACVYAAVKHTYTHPHVSMRR